MLPPVAVAVAFIDAINHGDIDRLAGLMSDDHRLEVFDEEPFVGREANVEAWSGYFDGFPNYVIYPRRIAEADGVVAVLGHTTGSHLGLSEAEELRLTLIWIAHIDTGLVTRWRLLEDTIETREEFGFSD